LSISSTIFHCPYLFAICVNSPSTARTRLS